jgi:hypothetical protein
MTNILETEVQSDLPIFATDKFAELVGLQIIHAKNYENQGAKLRPRLVGRLNQEIFHSPGVGTFGGFFNLQKDSVHENIKDVLNEFSSQIEGNEIAFTLPPNHIVNLYPQGQKDALLRLGGDLLFDDVNHAILIPGWSRSSLSRGNQKKLRQCHENALTFSQLNLSELDRLYEILRQNRENLGATVSMTLEQVKKSFETFPDKYFAFGVFFENQMIAGAVCLESAPDNFYVYMWGDILEFRHMSPIVFLCESLIEFAASKDFSYLDLGTSSLKGEVMPGVSRFKENLGAKGYKKTSIMLETIE